jgi:5-methylcytosine-specific restriction endonuclease McrA
MTTTTKTVGQAGRNSPAERIAGKSLLPRPLALSLVQETRNFCPAMKYLQQQLADAGYEELAYWRYAYHRQGAPLLDELAAVLDHVTAFSAGGPGNAENLVTACNKCNTRKSNSHATAWEREHPVKPIKSKYGEPVKWDGFSNLFLYFAEKYAANLTKTEKAWVKALKNERPTAQT